MENQHRLIQGYRELTKDEIDNMNYSKAVESEVLEFIQSLWDENESDRRWLSIAKTDLEQGFMALGRSIARPDGY